MTIVDRPRILCVDDESRVVDGLSLLLRKDYEVFTASSGAEGLLRMSQIGNVAVVVSDMRMPEMNGAAFLHEVMRTHPDATRILLTGELGRDTAVQAVNEGQVFRFLTKPCPPQQLLEAIEAGVVQFRLMNVERSVLQETLIGCIHALVDVLAIANPVAFGRASRIKRLAMDFAQSLGCVGFWQLEAAAMLSQLGYLALPANLVEKLYYGEALTAEESVLADAVPAVGGKLLAHIPRMEPVLQILRAIGCSDVDLAALGNGAIGMGARILLIVLEYDGLLTQGLSRDVAMQTVRAKSNRFGSPLLEKFSELIGAGAGSREVREMPLRLVTPGMIIVHDLRTHAGTLLVPRGFEVSETFLARLRNVGASILQEKIQVIVPVGRSPQTPAPAE